MKKQMIVNGICLGLTAAFALAAPPKSGERKEGVERRLAGDENENGLIEKEEFLARAELKFKRADANADGSLDKEERRAAMKQKRKKLHGKKGAKGMKDRNNDGKITVEDFPEKKKEHFSKIDTDGNGEISKEERKAFRKVMREKRGNKNPNAQ